MDKVTIPATKNTKAKTFEVGEVYFIPDSHTGRDWITVIEKIDDGQIKFRVLNPNPSRKYIRATTEQFSNHTKYADKDYQKIIRHIFSINPEFL